MVKRKKTAKISRKIKQKVIQPPVPQQTTFFNRLIKYGVPATAVLGILGSLYYRNKLNYMNDAYSKLNSIWADDSSANFVTERKLKELVQEMEKMKLADREDSYATEDTEYSSNGTTNREYSQSYSGLNASHESSYLDDPEEQPAIELTEEEKPGRVQRLINFFTPKKKEKKNRKQEAKESVDLPMPEDQDFDYDRKKGIRNSQGKIIGYVPIEIPEVKRRSKKEAKVIGNGSMLNRGKSTRKSTRKTTRKTKRAVSVDKEADEILQKRPSLNFPYSTSNRIYDGVTTTLKYGVPLGLAAVGLAGRKKIKRAAVDVYKKLKELSGFYLTDGSPDVYTEYSKI